MRRIRIRRQVIESKLDGKHLMQMETVVIEKLQSIFACDLDFHLGKEKNVHNISVAFYRIRLHVIEY